MHHSSNKVLPQFWLEFSSLLRVNVSFVAWEIKELDSSRSLFSRIGEVLASSESSDNKGGESAIDFQVLCTLNNSHFEFMNG